MLVKLKRLENTKFNSRRRHGIRKFRGACLYTTKAISSVDAPETNLIVGITRAEKIGFLRVKIKGHYRCIVTRNCSYEVTRLHKLVVVSHKSEKEKMDSVKKEMNYYTLETSHILIVLSKDDVAS